MSSNIAIKYSNVDNTYKVPQIAKIKQTAKAGTLPRKENGVPTDEKAKEHAGKRGVKRLASDCDLCAAKRLKTMVT